MNWAEFQIEKEYYRKAWELLKVDYTGDLGKFLNKSYLIVSCKWHFGIDNDLITAGKDCPQFFISKGVAEDFLEIINEIKILEGIKAGNKKEEIEDLIDEINDLNKKSIFVVDDWTIGPVFPTINMDFIQTIKKSSYCDQERTIMRAYSIAVVIKKIEKL